jgi:hypothetical protein
MKNKNFWKGEPVLLGGGGRGLRSSYSESLSPNLLPPLPGHSASDSILLSWGSAANHGSHSDSVGFSYQGCYNAILL